MNHFRILLSIVLFSTISFLATAKPQVVNLVTEYHENPIGIDIEKPRLSWQILSDEQNVMQSAYEIRVADSPQNLGKKSKQFWSTGKVESDKSVNLEYEGPALKSMQRSYWQVRVWDNNGKASEWSEPAFWETGLLEPQDWKAAWITFGSEKETEESKPAHYYRKEFSAKKKVKSARVYVTSKGLYQLFINGEKVSDDLFTPGWTSYNKRLQYQTYDVTALLNEKNAVGAIVGDGWFRGRIARNLCYGNKLAFLMQLQIIYSDGTSEIVTSDKSWKVSTGPILESDIYNGEVYDARMEMPGWNRTDFDDNKWENATEVSFSNDILVAQRGVPVKAIQEIQPLKLIKTPKGELVFDMGQNMVGWVRLKVKGKAGDQITLKFAEVLDKEGNFYTDNLRKAKAREIYILKGGDEEIFEPNFTFFGFRFVMLEGFAETPDLDQLTGIVIHSDMKPTGTFTCSDSMINQLQSNIQWGQKGNFLDVPTDCPQRDERLGWTGDAQVFAPTAAFNFDVSAFYTKWLKDLAADQLADGKVPDVIPDVRNGRGGSTAWADAALIVPWTMYLTYGDKRILEEQYNSMKGWVDYMQGRAGDDFLWTGDNHYGDWLAFASTSSSYTGATTEKDLIATAYYCYSSMLLGKIAGITGNKVDTEKYDNLAENIKKAFVNEFVTPAGRLISHTQTAYSLALAFDLLPENLVPAAAKYLAGDVKKMGHLTTGFVGTPLLCKTLSDQGYEDLAFMLLNRKEYPSWLYPVTQGATTIWERWDGQKPDGTFQTVGMNSFNHYAYGAIGEWLYTSVAGIKIDEENPGYKHFYLDPHPGGGLTHANAEFDSMYGKIKSAWKIEGENFIYEVEIPANTSATVVLPYSKEVKELGSGKYSFKVKSAFGQDNDTLFDRLNNSNQWELKLADEWTGNWQSNWYLDGLIAKVENTPKGIHLKAGPEFGNDAHHMVLWTKKSFEGDVKIEFEYTRTDNETKAVNILYIQATGKGEGEFTKDIFEWNNLREVPSMRTYFNNMKALHISFAAFPNDEETQDYVRARRYPVTAERGFGQLEIPPTYFNSGLFKTNETYKLTVVKTDAKLFFKVEGKNLTKIFTWDTNQLSPLKEGRIGLRHMYTRSALYKDFKVWTK